MAAVYVDRLADCRTALRRILRDGRDTSAVTLELQGLVFLSAAHRYQLLTVDYLCRRAPVAAARGDTATTRALTDEMTLWAAPRRVGPAGELASHVPTALFLVMDLVEAAVGTGRRTEAAAHVAAVRKAGISAISARLAMTVEAAAALTALGPRASELFERALSTPGTDRWPLERARVRLAYGEHPRRARAAADARPHLADALDTFHRLGARPRAARAAGELRATGASAGRTAEHADELGPASLTPRQRETAQLAASTNSSRNSASPPEPPSATRWKNSNDTLRTTMRQ
ncbi:hypothetical protein [Streptomyces sp. NPDC051704]|uniref:hypothetical protein n=1 Tax=Streptomyces sp. NPDC051704 TaxID=3365671 RepID=UPI0037906D2E